MRGLVVSGIVWKIYITAFYLYLFWYLLGILAIAGWIKPTGIVWFDAAVTKSEKFVRVGWEHTGKWFGKSALIIIFCLGTAVMTFAFAWIVVERMRLASQ